VSAVRTDPGWESGADSAQMIRTVSRITMMTIVPGCFSLLISVGLGRRQELLSPLSFCDDGERWMAGQREQAGQALRAAGDPAGYWVSVRPFIRARAPYAQARASGRTDCGPADDYDSSRRTAHHRPGQGRSIDDLKLVDAARVDRLIVTADQGKLRLELGPIECRVEATDPDLRARGMLTESDTAQ
jgi:hypothetical protein